MLYSSAWFVSKIIKSKLIKLLTSAQGKLASSARCYEFCTKTDHFLIVLEDTEGVIKKVVPKWFRRVCLIVIFEYCWYLVAVMESFCGPLSTWFSYAIIYVSTQFWIDEISFYSKLILSLYTQKKLLSSFSVTTLIKVINR